MLLLVLWWWWWVGPSEASRKFRETGHPSGLIILDFCTRLQLLKSPTTLKVKIVERSIQNNRFCFLELARKSGTMTEAELVVLSQWYEFLERNMTLDLDLIVYLRSTPSVAYQRMKKRNRSEESGAPEIYLERLHNAYEEWLVKQRHGKIEVK